MIKSIVFDMDGVLFDTEKVCGEAWKSVGRKLNIKNIEYLISSCRGINEEDTKKFIEKNYEGKVSGDECMMLFKESCKDIVQKSGVPVKTGVYELLEYLKENNYNIALATSTNRETVIGYLKEVKIFKYFNAIITGDMIEKGKPEPDIYLRACKEIEKNPEDCIAIEDSFNGIKSAYRAGMKVIMVPDLLQPTEEIKKLLFKKFNSLFDVKKFLEEERK